MTEHLYMLLVNYKEVDTEGGRCGSSKFLSHICNQIQRER